MVVAMAGDSYVIQMDADTLTFSSLDEVAKHYRENRSFTLGTRMGQNLLDFHASSQLVANSTGNHVQVAGGRNLPELSGFRRVVMFGAPPVCRLREGVFFD